MKIRPPRPTKGAERDNAQMSLMDHLRELRGRIIKSVLAILVGGIVCYVFYEAILDLLTDPYCRSLPGTEECELIILDVLGGFVLRMKVALYGGFLVGLPVILWQLWQFIVPGLYKNERRYTVAFVVSSVLLFALGAVLAYHTLPQMIEWLRGAGAPEDSAIVAVQTADRYLWLSAMMMVGFGIGFEFPVVLIALEMVGVLDSATLRSWRRQAIVAIVVVVAMITPGGDPISLVALSVPMYLFYEISIFAGWLIGRRRRRAELAGVED